nr:hypothetical protein [Planctomycetota bacterium]
MATTRITAGQTRKSTEFEDFADTIVHADVRIAAGRAKALLVFRQRDSGIWYALCGSRRPRLVRVTLRQLFAFDRTLAGLGEMPHGKGVSRGDATSSWTTCPAPPSADQEGFPYLLDVARLRTSQWADQSAAMLIFPGLICGLGAGYLVMMGAPATGGASTTWAVPLGIASAWLFMSGVITGATRHALWVLIGALGMVACVALPLLRPEYALGRWRPALALPAVLALLLL